MRRKDSKEPALPPTPAKEITNDDVKNYDAGLTILRREKARPKLAFKVGHVIGQLTTTFKAIGDREHSLRAEHLVVDEQGNAARKDGQIQYLDGHTREMFERDLKELYDAPADITLPKSRFRLQDFEESGIGVSADTLLLLGELVVFDDEGAKNGTRP